MFDVEDKQTETESAVRILYLARSRCARPLPRYHATYAGYPASPPRRVAELVFWTIVGGLRSQKTKEESQPPVRAKVGATWVSCRKSESIMKAELVEAASKVIISPQ